MPEVRVICPGCQATLKANSSSAEGLKIKCPRCQTVTPVPSSTATTAAVPDLARSMPTPMPMKATGLKKTAAAMVEPMDSDLDDEAPARRPKKKKPFDVLPIFITLVVLGYAGAAGASYFGVFDGKDLPTPMEPFDPNAKVALPPLPGMGGAAPRAGAPGGREKAPPMPKNKLP